ncbi:hypothetical protein [Mucilaginibacter sp. SJ]|uniref:hypothetical protein n=1 Tax=Mucilaginibacter sp. SJ TaxID=3029053 RepID=UPI0023A9DB17|nr:hypothetical protein [Mucilaginibacter sp. SJ]WEA00721.1 hypothetical protein MusilaSJ_25025 [Mucilaginibacter sp. SJ]
MEAKNTAILKTFISELEFSNEFILQSSAMGFETIEEITDISPELLINWKGFDYNWLGELIRFLSKHQLLEVLQPLPGSSRG